MIKIFRNDEKMQRAIAKVRATYDQPQLLADYLVKITNWPGTLRLKSTWSKLLSFSNFFPCLNKLKQTLRDNKHRYSKIYIDKC